MYRAGRIYAIWFMVISSPISLMIIVEGKDPKMEQWYSIENGCSENYVEIADYLTHRQAYFSIPNLLITLKI